MIVIHKQKDNAKWAAPEFDCLKLNVDALILKGSLFFEIGMTLRNHNVLSGKKVMRFDKEVFVFEAKTVKIYDALSWMMIGPESRVCIHSLQAINERIKYVFEIGHILHACRLKLTSKNGVS